MKTDEAKVEVWKRRREKRGEEEEEEEGERRHDALRAEPI